MGLSLEFYAGDSAAIGVAFSDFEEDWHDGPVLAYADFSLHLSLDHLDLLSEAVAEPLALESLPLTGCLGAEVGALDAGETGAAHILDRAWVGRVAFLREADAPLLTD